MMHEIEHIFNHTFMDVIKVLPFLFIAFLIIEFIHTKMNKKNIEKLQNSKKVGPLVGGFLGVFPQCGFATLATNLFSSRIITLGTLISAYLVTSDEMIVVLLASDVDVSLILSIIVIKLVVGISAGFIIDFLIKRKESKLDFDLCKEDNCHCHDNIFIAALKHTIKIFLFIFIVSAILDYAVHALEHEYLEGLFLKDNIFAPFITTLIGLIPTCAGSIILTELFIAEAITFASLVAGLLTGTGVAILVLFRVNKNLKENIKILLTIYLIGSITGIVLGLFI